MLRIENFFYKSITFTRLKNLSNSNILYNIDSNSKHFHLKIIIFDNTYNILYYINSDGLLFIDLYNSYDIDLWLSNEGNI